MTDNDEMPETFLDAVARLSIALLNVKIDILFEFQIAITHMVVENVRRRNELQSLLDVRRQKRQG